MNNVDCKNTACILKRREFIKKNKIETESICELNMSKKK